MCSVLVLLFSRPVSCLCLLVLRKPPTIYKSIGAKTNVHKTLAKRSPQTAVQRETDPYDNTPLLAHARLELQHAICCPPRPEPTWYWEHNRKQRTHASFIKSCKVALAHGLQNSVAADINSASQPLPATASARRLGTSLCRTAAPSICAPMGTPLDMKAM